ncbi:MAG: D-aminoacyl-tRNA deacylase [Thermoplasmatota archaeon]
MRLLVCNLGDNASINMRDRLLEASDPAWEPTGETFRAGPVRRRGDDLLVDIEGPAIHDEALTDDIEAAGWAPDAVWFLSRHRAASGQPSLTVHPMGNHDAAQYGGQPRSCATSAPRDMGALLRRLAHHAEARGLEHGVTYEATHHGPLMLQPSLFVEIGSDEAWYDDRPSAEVHAQAMLDVLDGRDGGGAPEEGAPVLLGVGGGHYVPQQTTKALAGEADFGHLVAAYGLPPDDPEACFGVLDRVWAATPGASGVYLHKKGLKGPQRQIVRDWCEARGVELV